MSTMTVSTEIRSSGFARPLRAGRPLAPTASPPASPAVRVTRRGRLLVTLVLLLMAVAAAVVLTGGASALAGTDQPTVAHERVTVLPGQTLWQIAERSAPGADPRETVQRILDLNGLQTAQVEAGTALLLP